jgi:hypothetical protein
VSYSEARTIRRFKAFLRRHRGDMALAANLGDGQAGYLIQILKDELGVKPLQRAGKRKREISRDLQRRVFERDQYRCRYCGTHLDLCCDHIHPESKGGATTFENLQTLCRPCNSAKGSTVDEAHF